jgi:membrane protease YdiL (CAAX protease family)
MWIAAAGTGSIAGGIGSAIASPSGQGMKLSDDIKLILLQLTLGPVLEEILFRGYLFAVLLWGLTKLRRPTWDGLVVRVGAMVFAVVPLSQLGPNWLQMACIASTARYTARFGVPQARQHRRRRPTLFTT